MKKTNIIEREIAGSGLMQVKDKCSSGLYKNRMKTKLTHPKFTTVIAGALALGAATAAHAQYTPPPPPTPFSGFINEWLRQQNPYLAALDIGGGGGGVY